MRFWSIACMVGVASLLAGCLGAKPKPQSAELAQTCVEPKYTIALGDIKSGNRNILSKDEFLTFLNKGIQKSNCFIVQSKIKDPKVGYVLDIEYDFELSEVQEKKMLSSKDSVSLKSEVKFYLSKPDNKIIQSAVSTTKMSGKKYLGVGENVHITQEQKEDLIARSLNTIFTNLSSL